jgi:hypothetical protein
MRFRKVRCSFCRKDGHHVSKRVPAPRLIVGPKVYVSDECVAVASSIMQGNMPLTSAVPCSLGQGVRVRWSHLPQRPLSRAASAA